MSTTFNEDVRITGNLTVNGDLKPARPRSEIAQEQLAAYPVPLSTAFVWDSGQPLPAAAANDDLTLSVGTFGTDTPALSAGDVKATSSTRRARFTLSLPPEYEAGETVQIRVVGGMLTTIADGSCTVDIEAYLKEGNATPTAGGDLCSTSATTINSLSFANKDFTIDSSSLSPGDELDVRISVAYVDTATATAVKPTIDAIKLLCDIRG